MFGTASTDNWIVYQMCTLISLLFTSVSAACFLLLARYVPNPNPNPNVVLGVHDIIIYWRPTDRRPTSHLGKFRMAISILYNGSSDPLHVCSSVGFSGSADRMALLPVGPNRRWRPAAVFENFEWPYLCNRSSDPHPLLVSF